MRHVCCRTIERAESRSPNSDSQRPILADATHWPPSRTLRPHTNTNTHTHTPILVVQAPLAPMPIPPPPLKRDVRPVHIYTRGWRQTRDRPCRCVLACRNYSLAKCSLPAWLMQPRDGIHSTTRLQLCSMRHQSFSRPCAFEPFAATSFLALHTIT